jgi:hypothetical protein
VCMRVLCVCVYWWVVGVSSTEKHDSNSDPRHPKSRQGVYEPVKGCSA